MVREWIGMLFVKLKIYFSQKIYFTAIFTIRLIQYYTNAKKFQCRKVHLTLKIKRLLLNVQFKQYQLNFIELFIPRHLKL